MASFEGEHQLTPPALLLLMNLLVVSGEVTFGKVFPTELALDLGSPNLGLASLG